MKNKKVYFNGMSGISYPFVFYPLDSDLPEIGAVYIFTRENGGSKVYNPLYIGQTDVLMSSISHHDRWDCVVRHFVDSICVHYQDHAAERIEIARDLIGCQLPPCN